MNQVHIRVVPPFLSVYASIVMDVHDVLVNVEMCVSSVGASVIRYDTKTRKYGFSSMNFGKSLILILYFAIVLVRGSRNHVYEELHDTSLMPFLLEAQAYIWFTLFVFEVFTTFVLRDFLSNGANTLLHLEHRLSQNCNRHEYYKRTKVEFDISTVLLVLYLMTGYLLAICVAFEKIDIFDLLSDLPYYCRVWQISVSFFYFYARLKLINTQFTAVKKLFTVPSVHLSDLRWLFEHIDRCIKCVKDMIQVSSWIIILGILLVVQLTTLKAYQILDVVVYEGQVRGYSKYFPFIVLIGDLPVFFILLICSMVGNILDAVSLDRDYF